MNAVKRLEAAVKRLDQVRSSLGFMAVGEDPTQLYARCEEDDDDNGEPFATGLSIGGGVDADEEINDAIVLLSNTLTAQQMILHFAIDFATMGVPGDPTGGKTLADAILGGAS